MNDDSINNIPALEAINLTKVYEDKVKALDSVSFAVKPGEIFALLGANGAGKTTAINIFLNFIEPTSGEVRINGIVASKEPLEAKKNVAFVSENVMLYSNFTAIQNLDFFAKLGGQVSYSRSDYHDILFRVGLEEKFHTKKLRDFSKGMRQKCGIAIAILKNSPAVLLDEPTSGLDPKAGRDFIDLLKSLKAENKAILMSTHDIFRAKDVADTVAIMDQGQLVMKKPVAEIADKDLEQIYLHYMSGLNGTEIQAGGNYVEGNN
ncbi:MAG: ABC transporter ATP-binding protein [candidate division Zixibacteria bacterium]|nr:ABC transporter ATP-binding protein [candidate division Zixibacteria bacterium]